MSSPPKVYCSVSTAADIFQLERVADSTRTIFECTINEARDIQKWLNDGGLDPYPPGIDDPNDQSKPPRRFRVSIYSMHKWLAVDRQTGEAILKDTKQEAMFWCQVRGGKF